MEIDADSDKTLITGFNSRFELQAQNPDEFPEVANFDDQDYFEINANVLQELIKRTLFATDSESSRYALGGVLLEMDDKTITAVGTDGRRLAKMQGVLKKVGNPQSGVHDHRAVAIDAVDGANPARRRRVRFSWPARRQ